MVLAQKETSVGIKIEGQIDPSLEQSISSAKEKLGDLEKEAGSTSGGLEGLGDKTGKTSEKMDGFSDEAGSAGNALEDFTQVMAAAGVLQKLGDIYDGFMDCSAAAAEYEISLKKVQTIADTSSVSMEDISSSIMQLSNETGVVAKDLSEAAYQAVSASVDTAKSVGFVNNANQLAVGGFTNASSAVDVLTTAINAYGLEADNAAQVSDYLITTQNKGKTTVGELASSLGKVIPVAAAYNIQMDNLSAAFAVMTANGIQTAETATYIKSMLNELSDTGSAVAKELAAQTGKSFSELGAAGYSLGDVMQILGDSVDGSTVALSNLWGSSEAGTAALSLYNSGAQKYNEVLGEMRNSAGATEKAYQTMTETVGFSQQRMQTASENIQISIGENLNPVMKNVYDMAADILSGTQEFIEKNPDTVAAITSVAAAAGTFTAAITIATAAVKAFTIAKTALNAVSGIGWIAAGAGIASAVAGIAAYVSLTDDAVDVTEELTFGSRDMERELKALNRQYDEACKKYGKSSEEASRLALEVETLQQEYDKTKQKIGEFVAEIDRLSQSVSDTYKTYGENIKSTQELSDGSAFLVSGLAALENQSGITEAQMQTMAGIVGKLNDNYSELGLTIDETTGKLNYSTDELFEYVTKTAEKKKQEAARESLVSSLQVFPDLKESVEKTKKEEDVAFKEYMDLYNKRESEHPVLMSIGVTGKPLMQAREKFNELSNKSFDARQSYNESIENIREYASQLGYTGKELDSFIDSLENSSDAAEKSSKSLNSAGKINTEYARGMEKASEAAQGISGKLNEIAASYDKAYSEAYKSIDGQMGLFDRYGTKTKMTTDKMVSAWKSQEKYLEKYSKNIKKASNAGLDDTVLKKLSDGSQEAAGQLDAIVRKYKEIENSDGKKAAKKWIKQFNQQFKEVEKSKENFSGTVAGMETDFDKSMKGIVSELEKSVKDMDMSGTAGKAAEATMDAYILAIKNKTAEAAREASAMAEAVSAAMELGDSKSTRKGKNYTKKHDNSSKEFFPVPEAEGDILTKPTLAWIAEAGYDEAAIPINGSARSKALWEETGRRLGMLQEGNTKKSAVAALGRLDGSKVTAGSRGSSINAAGSTKIDNSTKNTQDITLEIPFSPVVNIYGSADRKEIKEAGKEIKMSYADFKKHMGSYIEEYLRRTTGQGVRHGKLYNSIR